MNDGDVEERRTEADARAGRLYKRRRPPTFFIVDEQCAPVFRTADLVRGPLLSECIDALKVVLDRLGTLADTAFVPVRSGVLLRIVPMSGERSGCYAVFIEAMKGRESLKDAVRGYDLTKREAEVLQLLLNGFSTPQIAERLAIANGTVGDHVKALFRKTNTNKRSELVARVFQAEFEDDEPRAVPGTVPTVRGERRAGRSTFLDG